MKGADYTLLKFFSQPLRGVIELVPTKYLMKTLGIFGDSFASLDANKPRSLHTAWPQCIDRSGIYQTTVIARPCTSFYWTYRNFLEQHGKFEKIVCIVTKPGRVTIRNHPYFMGMPFGSSGLAQCEYMLTKQANKLTDHERKIIESIRDYMIYAQDYDYERDANAQLLEHLKRLRPDAIFIPMGSALPNLANSSMLNFVELICRSLKPEMLDVFFPKGLVGGGWYPQHERDLIQCHMTPEVNQLFADHVLEALKMGIWAPQLPDTIAHQHTWEDYYGQRPLFD